LIPNGSHGRAELKKTELGPTQTKLQLIGNLVLIVLYRRLRYRKIKQENKSLVFMRENRPIFQKLAPVICNDDDRQNLQNCNVKVYDKREYAMDTPYNMETER
jgi:hypothetical protein